MYKFLKQCVLQNLQKLMSWKINECHYTMITINSTYTYGTTADDDYSHPFHRSCHPHDPCHTNKQKHSKDILYCGQVHS